MMRRDAIKGIVVCPQPRAADAGAAVLRGGGTAFDAAIATAFCQMVQDPFMCGIGGMGTLQWRTADGRQGMIDFHARAGAGVSPEMWAGESRGRSEISAYAIFDDFRAELGYRSIMTPGTVAGFARFHERFCTRDWKDLLAPAIRMAREGVAVTPFAHDFLTRRPQPGLPDGKRRASTTKACAELYLDAAGEPKAVGEIIRHTEMAATFERLATHGASDFYSGDIAGLIAEDFATHGAFVTAEDLDAYRVREGAPVIGTYRGYQICSNPPPGSGAVLIAMLNVLEQFDFSGVHPGSLRHFDLVARAMGAAHEDRERELADPDFFAVPVAEMISKERAAAWAARIRDGWLPGGKIGQPPSCTTHFSVWDAAGNSVSCTHTLGTGAGVVTRGLGFNWNNAMKLFDMRPGQPNSMAPGKARTTGMVPTMVLKDGEPFLIVGAPGGSVIISAVLTTIVNVIDFGMGAVEAVSFPRIHCEGGPVFCEARVQGDVVDGLRAIGHDVRHSVISYDPVMSRAHAVLLRDGQVAGGADPRGGGGVAIAW